MSGKPADPSTSNSDADELTKSYNCDLCTEKFHLLNLLRLHKKTFHAPSKPFRCDECREQFNFEKNLKLHTASHSRAPASCPECGVHFQRSASYRSHLKTHMVFDNFRCKKCETEFQYEEYCRHHLEVEHQQIDIAENDYESGFEERRETRETQARKYSCDVCGSKFTKPSNLARHKMIHLERKPFQCAECSMQFTQKATLQRHSLLHSGEKNFKCPKCSVKFLQRGNLKTHMRRVHPQNPDLTNKFPCPNCSCVFNKLNSLNRHSARMHSTKLSANNEDSGDEEYSFEKVMAQLKSLQGVDSPSDSLFPNGNVEVPIIGSAPIPNALDSSAECGYVKIVETLNTEQEKSEVVVMHVVVDGCKYFCCDICSKRFQRPYDLLRHNRVHTNEKPYECGICGRCFAIKKNLYVHLRIHGKDNDRITNCYQCPKCITQFSSLRQLDQHVKIHGNLKLFSCSVCNKHFRNTNNLRVHKYTHRAEKKEERELLKSMSKPIVYTGSSPSTETSEERLHLCSVCGLRFKRLVHLREHELRHIGQKPHQCATCQRHFTTRSSLKTHEKIHSGHKAKQCDQCNAKFHSNTELLRHKTIHSAARFVFCPYCHKSFKTKGTCQTHIRTHTKELVQKKPAETATVPLDYPYVLVLDDENQTGSNESQSENVIYLQLDDTLAQNQVGDETATSQITSEPQTQPLSEKSSKFIAINDLLTKPTSTKVLRKTITIQSVEKPPVTPLAMPEDPQPKTDADRKHTCDKCSKAFKKPIDLRRHHRTHTKEKPFECDICQASFSLKCILDRHKQIHNERREKFDCQVCGKSYASQSVLKTHLRIHTNERPYPCEYCEKSFRTIGHRSSHLRAHMKSKEIQRKQTRK